MDIRPQVAVEPRKGHMEWLIAAACILLHCVMLGAPIFAILFTVAIKNATWVEKVMLLPIYIVSAVTICDIANITCPIPQVVTVPCCWAYGVWATIESIKYQITKGK